MFIEKGGDKLDSDVSICNRDTVQTCGSYDVAIQQVKEPRNEFGRGPLTSLGFKTWFAGKGLIPKWLG
eukprot:197015-Amphidinium_carterae.1